MCHSDFLHAHNTGDLRTLADMTKLLMGAPNALSTLRRQSFVLRMRRSSLGTCMAEERQVYW